jgi:hypothetical protein
MGQGESITKFDPLIVEKHQKQYRCVTLSLSSNQKNNDQDNQEEDSDFDSIMIKRQYLMIVLVNPYDLRCCLGCAGKLVIGIVIHDDMLPIRSLAVEFIARDQGYGTIGHSKVVLMTQNQEKQLKRSHELVTLTRNKTKSSLTIESTHRLFEGLSIGDTIGVWAICQNELGNQCAVEDCVLTLHITRNWFRRKNAILFLYTQKFLKLSNWMKSSYVERMDRSSPLYFVFCNHDLCRKIVGYL